MPKRFIPYFIQFVIALVFTFFGSAIVAFDGVMRALSNLDPNPKRDLIFAAVIFGAAQILIIGFSRLIRPRIKLLHTLLISLIAFFTLYVGFRLYMGIIDIHLAKNREAKQQRKLEKEMTSLTEVGIDIPTSWNPPVVEVTESMKTVIYKEGLTFELYRDLDVEMYVSANTTSQTKVSTISLSYVNATYFSHGSGVHLARTEHFHVIDITEPRGKYKTLVAKFVEYPGDGRDLSEITKVIYSIED